MSGGGLSFDVLDEELVPVPLGHRKHMLESFEFRLLLFVHAMASLSTHKLAGLDQ